MNKKFFYLTLPLLLLLSCSQETLTEVTDDTLSVEEVSATTQSLLIDKDAVSDFSKTLHSKAYLIRRESEVSFSASLTNDLYPSK